MGDIAKVIVAAYIVCFVGNNFGIYAGIITWCICVWILSRY